MTSELIQQSPLSQSTIDLTHQPKQWQSFKHQFWKSEPYPHIFIDNFLPDALLQKVVQDFQVIDGSAAPTEIYNTDIELNKVCFEASSSFINAQSVVNCLAGTKFINILEELLEISNIIPLPKFRTENKSSRKYLHIMRDGGFLGSHVDQSHIESSHVHVLSCIFYASPRWTEIQGGHTILFNKDGSQSLTQIEYKPNRLAVFLHTSESFHGVSRLQTSHNRYSIYMDYYLPIQKLAAFKSKFTQLSQRSKPKYWRHDVIFFPHQSKHEIYSHAYINYQKASRDPSQHFDTWQYSVYQLLRSGKSHLHRIKNKLIKK